MHKQKVHFAIMFSLLVGILITPRLASGSSGPSFDPATPAEARQAILAHIFGEGPILHAENAAEDDLFGSAVAISGDTLVVGAYLKDDGGEINSGAAYIFERNWGGLDNWGLVATLHASNPESNTNFGTSVAISGDTVVVGSDWANGVDQNGDTIFSTGAAYIFERNQGGPNRWGQVDVLRASDAQTYDGFGNAVAISGDILVVGADSEDTGGNNAGAAYVFERDLGNPNNWSETTILHASNAGYSDRFGWSVSISGFTLAVGAIWESTLGEDAGAAYVFERGTLDTTIWHEVALHASNGLPGDCFGISVAISGDTLVVGASKEDSGGDDTGAAYVFERNQGGTNQWGEVDILYTKNATDGNHVGEAVAISGDTLVLGAIWGDGKVGVPGFDSGEAYLFERSKTDPNNWDESAALYASDAQRDDMFGVAVAIDGDTLVVGASREDGGTGNPFNEAGAAYVFGPPIDLGISAVAPLNAEPGETIQYTLSFSNTGEATARDVVVSDIIPAELIVTNVTGSGTITNTGAVPPYTWEVEDLGSYTGGTINLTVELTRCLPVGELIVHAATINTSKAQDIDLTNNNITMPLTVLNAAPVAVNDEYIAIKGDPLVVNPSQGILTNDDDANCDSLTVALNAAPAHGNLALAANGSFVYTPAAGFNGTDVFTYTVSDGQGGSDTATVTITVGGGYPIYLPVMLKGIP